MLDGFLHSVSDLTRYDYLWRLSPDRWAWEFLRRNQEFRRDAAQRKAADVAEREAPCGDIRLLRPRTAQTLAERRGLVIMPDHSLDAFSADVIWNRGAFPDQVELNCSPRAPGQVCEIWDRTVPRCDITHITDAVGREYMLLRRDGAAC